MLLGSAVLAMVMATPWSALAQLSAPSIGCAKSTHTTIWVQVCAGASGAPAGFTIEWTTLEAYQGGTPDFCKAYYKAPTYALEPGECIYIEIGNFPASDVEVTCKVTELLCDTAYVFRVYANATQTEKQSPYSGITVCYTEPCPKNGCTHTLGYWKIHSPIPTGNNVNEWPVSSLILGTVTYTDLQLLAILNTSVAGNGLISLAHQLIGAKLNIANGASAPPAVLAAIAYADSLIGSLVIPPIGTDYLSPKSVSGLITILTAYNEGIIGPGHCPDDVIIVK